MNQETENTLEDLQSRLAFQEDAIDALNKTIAEQSAEINLLQQQLKYLHDQLKQLQELQKEQAEAQGQHEVPPHY